MFNLNSNLINEDVKELVKARLSILPQNIKISIGSEGSFSRDELIEHINEGDKIGKKIIEINMDFLRALKKGEFYE